MSRKSRFIDDGAVLSGSDSGDEDEDDGSGSDLSGFIVSDDDDCSEDGEDADNMDEGGEGGVDGEEKDGVEEDGGGDGDVRVGSGSEKGGDSRGVCKSRVVMTEREWKELRRKKRKKRDLERRDLMEDVQEFVRDLAEDEYSRRVGSSKPRRKRVIESDADSSSESVHERLVEEDDESGGGVDPVGFCDAVVPVVGPVAESDAVAVSSEGVSCCYPTVESRVTSRDDSGAQVERLESLNRPAASRALIGLVKPSVRRRSDSGFQKSAMDVRPSVDPVVVDAPERWSRIFSMHKGGAPPGRRDGRTKENVGDVDVDPAYLMRKGALHHRDPVTGNYRLSSGVDSI